ncbi:MAG: ABC transporter permease [Candidatus Atribacteria bacterium]|nr:ABC transporter permease [Candidatus Atribacteria bacterium]
MSGPLPGATYKTERGIDRASLSEIIIWLAIVFLFIIMSFFSPTFLTIRNIVTVIKNLTTVAILSFGLTFVFISGGFDFSQGAILLYSAILIISFNPGTIGGVFLYSLLVMGIAVLFGTFNGVLIGFFHLNPFVVTLGLRNVIAGIIFISTAGMTVGATAQSPVLEYLGLGRFTRWLPVQTVFLIGIAIICWFVLRFTLYGRKLLLVGNSEIVSAYSGLKVEQLKCSSYIINGLLAGFAGILLGSQVSHLLPELAWHYDYDAITACAVGGISLLGGRGTILNTISGLLLLGFINNSMILLGLPFAWQQILKGLVLFVAVAADVWVRRKLYE